MNGLADSRATIILRREVDHMNLAGAFLGGPRTCPVHDANFLQGMIPIAVACERVAM
jgi:hypothetical protein